MRKPAIPDNAPIWLRIMLEILTGRRRNQIAVPPARTMPFSNPPTQAECEALAAQVEEIRAAQQQLIERFDS